MALHRFPIVVWQDAQDYFTALVLSDAIEAPPAATALAADRARQQLKDYLNWLYEREPWRTSTELVELELKQFTVRVRGEYHARQRVFACNEPFALRVPCVTAREKNGPLFAALPTLDLSFFYHEPSALAGLVSEYVQQTLKGSSPGNLARFVPPAKMELSEIVIRIKDGSPWRGSQREFPALDLVAEPLDDRAARRRFARAWLRESEAAAVAGQLRNSRANLLLVGPVGVGKTTLLAEAVRQLDRLPSAATDANDDREQQGRLHFWPARPPRSLPRNSQLRRPMAIPRNARSATLLSMANEPCCV